PDRRPPHRRRPAGQGRRAARWVLTWGVSPRRCGQDGSNSQLAGTPRRGSCRREPRRMSDDLDLAAGCSEVMVRRLLRGTGWTFIGMGSFVLYFLVYQLVGTNAVTSRGQTDLRNELQREWATAPAAPKKDPKKVEPRRVARGKA